MKRNIKYPVFIWAIVAVLTGTTAALAIDWPSNDSRVLENFGWNDRGSPSLFYSFESEGSIRSGDSGEIIFSRNPSDSVSNIPSPLGSWMAIEQTDGLIGIYGRYETREHEAISHIVEKDAILAFSGKSGWSSRTGFSFTFFDRKEKRWVNPAMILPVLRDTRAPVIRQVLLAGQDNRIINPSQRRNFPQGNYRILVDAVDTLVNANEPSLAPHRITCMVNGIETAELHMETFSGQNGSLMAYRKTAAPAAQVYSSHPSYEIGEVWFNRGQAVLEIIVTDVAGNSRNAVYRLTVE